MGEKIRQRSKFDLQNYHRRLKYADFYGNEGDSTPQPFTPTSNWTPPVSQLSPEILNLIQKDKKYFDKHFKFCHT